MVSIIESFIDADDTKLSSFLKAGLPGIIKRDADVTNRTARRVFGTAAGALVGGTVAKKYFNKEKKKKHSE